MCGPRDSPHLRGWYRANVDVVQLRYCLGHVNPTLRMRTVESQKAVPIVTGVGMSPRAPKVIIKSKTLLEDRVAFLSVTAEPLSTKRPKAPLEVLDIFA